MKRTMSEDDIFELTKFDKWQCEICGVKVKAELRGYDQKQKLKLMRNHLQLHTFPFRDPKDESINDYWCFSGEKIQEPQTNVR